MTDCSLPYIIDSEGHYRFKRKGTSGHIVQIAASILEAQFSCGDYVKNPTDTKRYLTFQLGALEHERRSSNDPYLLALTHNRAGASPGSCQMPVIEASQRGFIHARCVV